MFPICNLSSACFWKFPHKHSFVVLKKKGQLQWNPETSQSSVLWLTCIALFLSDIQVFDLPKADKTLTARLPSSFTSLSEKNTSLCMVQKEQWGLNHTPSEVKYEVCGPLLDPGSLSDSCCIMYSAQMRPANLLLPACTYLSIKHRSGYAAADSCRRYTHCKGERLSISDCPQCALSSSPDEKEKLCWKITDFNKSFIICKA